MKKDNSIDYSDLGKFTEELMKSYIAGEIDSDDFVAFIDTRINQMMGRDIILSDEGKKQLEVFSQYINQRSD
jgi:hypothetical protein